MTSPGSRRAAVPNMSSVTDQNVLEAIAHSLEFEIYSIESNQGRQAIKCRTVGEFNRSGYGRI